MGTINQNLQNTFWTINTP